MWRAPGQEEVVQFLEHHNFWVYDHVVQVVNSNPWDIHFYNIELVIGCS